MVGIRHAFSAALLILVVTASARAQPRWDVAGMGGVTAVRAPVDQNDPYSDDWFHTGVGGVSIGRYFTPHLKLELDVAATGTGTRFVQRFVTVPGLPTPYPVGAEMALSIRSLGAVATWQFFDNEWVHPFLSGGVVIDDDRRREHVWHQVTYVGDPRVPGNQVVITPERRTESHHTTVVRALIGGGAKFYVHERAFFKADTRVTFDGDRRQVVFRAGLGFDF